MKGILLRFRSSLAWAAAAAALGAACAAVLVREEKEEGGRITLFALNPEEAREIRVEFPGSDRPQIWGKYVSEHRWALQRPVVDEADYQVMERIAGYFSTLVAPIGFDAGTPEAAEMGPAKLKMTVSYRDGAVHWAEVGNFTASGLRVYARVSAREGVFEVSKAVWDAAWRSLSDYRDRGLFGVDYFDLTEMEIRDEAASVTYRLARDGEDWEILSPFKAAGDAQEAFKIAYDLDRLRASEFIDDSDAARTGMDKPAFKVAFKAEDSRISETIFALGERDGRKVWFAGVGGRGIVVALLEQDVGKVLDFRNPHRLREKRVFPAAAAGFSEIEVVGEYEGLNVSFAVSKGQFEGWRITKPQLRSVDEHKWETFYGNLAGLRVEDFLKEDPSAEDLASFGLDAPKLALKVVLAQVPGSEGARIASSVEIGSVLRSKGVAAARIDGKGPVVGLPLTFVEEMAGGFLRFLNRSLEPHNDGTVYKWKAEAQGNSVVWEKGESGQWNIVSPEGKGAVTSQNVMIATLKNGFNNAARYYAMAPYDEKEFGLDVPFVTLTFWFRERDNERQAVLYLSSRGPTGENVYSRYRKGDFRDMGDLVFGLNRSACENVLKLMEEALKE